MTTDRFPIATPKNDQIVSRQIAFFAAFVLPVYKLLEVPSLLARFAAGDLLLPALLQFLLQLGTLLGLLYLASRSEKTLFERMHERLGKFSVIFYIVYAIYFLLAAVLPLLDLEKFVYAAFYDTSPTLFSFALFFIFSAFLCVKGVKAVGRMADLGPLLFLFPFLALIVMSLVEADVTNLLPFFEKPFGDTVSALKYTTPQFSDVLLLLPLLGNLRYQKRDTVKIVTGYSAGAIFTLVFLAVFYGVYSSLALREHYAFAKIAQYFPVLAVVGRIDLLFVYLLCAMLFFYVALPLRHAVDCTTKIVGTKGKTIISALVNIAAFVFVLFCNKYYNGIYAFFGNKLYWLFALFTTAASTFFFSLQFIKKRQKRTQKENA